METEVIKVESSTIDEIYYNLLERKLIVTFKNGSKYQYDGVSEDVFKELISAESVCKYFTANIRNKYTTTKLS